MTNDAANTRNYVAAQICLEFIEETARDGVHNLSAIKQCLALGVRKYPDLEARFELALGVLLEKTGLDLAGAEVREASIMAATWLGVLRQKVEEGHWCDKAVAAIVKQMAILSRNNLEFMLVADQLMDLRAQFDNIYTDFRAVNAFFHADCAHNVLCTA